MLCAAHLAGYTRALTQGGCGCTKALTGWAVPLQRGIYEPERRDSWPHKQPRPQQLWWQHCDYCCTWRGHPEHIFEEQNSQSDGH